MIYTLLSEFRDHKIKHSNLVDSHNLASVCLRVISGNTRLNTQASQGLLEIAFPFRTYAALACSPFGVLRYLRRLKL